MFDPTIGRFLSLDPIGFECGDENLYRYVKNSPTNATDPTGMQTAAESAMEEQHFYGKGVHAYFDGEYRLAIEHFKRARRPVTLDPRIAYFQGLADLKLGNALAASVCFDQGSSQEHGESFEHEWVPLEVGRALQRIQGKDRLLLESHRRDPHNAFLRQRFMGILEANSQLEKLEDESAAALREKFYDILTEFNATSLRRLASGLRTVLIYRTRVDYGTAMRADEQLKDAAYLGACYDHRLIKSAVHMCMEGGMNALSRRTITHELAHAIDRGNGRWLSKTPEWHDVWKEEFYGKGSQTHLRSFGSTAEYLKYFESGDPMNRGVSERASTDPREAFADFLFLHNRAKSFADPGNDREALREKFPKAWAFLEKRGLIDPIP